MNKTDALIIGAGPTGLFTAHQLKLIGLSCEIVDNLDKIGGQCIELYPDKPIYDIPAVPECTGEELTNNLIERCKKSGFKSMCLTVDAVVAGNRERDRRTGFSTPPRLTLGSLLSFALHPAWSLNYLFRKKFELSRKEIRRKIRKSPKKSRRE